MKAGFYIVNREVRDTLLEKVSARTRANARAVVDWLVDNARWKDDAGGLMLKRGELVIGLEKTAAAIGVSVQNFRTVLQRLREVGFLTTSPAKERAKKLTTRNRKTNNPESRGRATEGQIVTIREYDAYSIPTHRLQADAILKVTTRNLKSNNSSKKYKLKEVDQKQLHVPLSIRLDAPLSVSDSDCKNGKAKTPPHQIAGHFRAIPNRSTARLTEKAQERIKARLQTYSVDELKTAIDGWKSDRWQMQNNGHRSMAWFFETDDRIEQYIGLWEVRKKPAAEPKAAVDRTATQTNGEARFKPAYTQEAEAATTNGTVDPEAACFCGNCRDCTNPPAVDNALCTRCQSGLCWKDPTTESPQAPIQPRRATNETPGFKPAYTRVGGPHSQGKAARGEASSLKRPKTSKAGAHLAHGQSTKNEVAVLNASLNTLRPFKDTSSIERIEKKRRNNGYRRDDRGICVFYPCTSKPPMGITASEDIQLGGKNRKREVNVSWTGTLKKSSNF